MNDGGREIYVLGVMSGSSLDGLDFAVCRFAFAGNEVADWSIEHAATYAYPPPWRARLQTAPHLPGRELMRLHTDLGRWIGGEAKRFLATHSGPPPALAAVHGHTVFHFPADGFTTQIGDGAAIAHRLQLPIITELRGADVAAGGQGAPLAPVADHYLFPTYDACVNLGGIANLSVRTPGGYVAGDVSGCCQILDRLAQKNGHKYDAGGQLAASGHYHADFVETFASLDYHARHYPKSLGNDWVQNKLWPLVNAPDLSPADAAHSFVRWLALRIALDLENILGVRGDGEGAPSVKSGAPPPLTGWGGLKAVVDDQNPPSETKPSATETSPNRRVLLTGGGTHHAFLVDQLRRTQMDRGDEALQFVIPDPEIVDFKEAALVALCGALRLRGRANALASATGAARDTVNGAVFIPTPALPKREGD